MRSSGRRVFLSLLVLGVWLVLWAFALEPASFRVRERPLALERWPSELDGLRVVVLADIHAGSPWNGLRNIARVVRETNAVKPDLVLIAGDLVIDGVLGGRFVSPEVTAQELARLEAPLGVYAVLGNHDWWLDGPRVARALEAAGVVMLEDSSVAIRPPHRFASGDSLWVAGVSDFWEGPHDVRRALRNVPPSAPTLLFTHNPDVFPEVPSTVSLGIAGHTHGGQVAIPFVGRPVVSSRYGERYAIGRIHEDGRDLFVSPGVGTSRLPVRFRVPPEVSLLVLRSVSR